LEREKNRHQQTKEKANKKDMNKDKIMMNNEMKMANLHRGKG